MKICFINPTKVLRRPIVELTSLLAKKGHKITLIYPEDKKRPLKNYHFTALLNNKNIALKPISSFDIEALRYSLPNPSSLIKTCSEALKTNDIVHIWEYYYPLSIAPLILKHLKKYKAKIVLTTDGLVGYTYKPNFLLTSIFRLYTTLLKDLLFKTPDKITFYFNALKDQAKKLNLPMKKILVIPTGINLEKFNIKSSDIRKEFKINKEKILITFIGMLTERKRPIMAIEATKRLRKKYNIHTLIAGEGYLDKILKQKAKGIKEITFTGNRNDIPDILKETDVLFSPGIGEGLPGVVMEASASKVPSVASREGGTPDIVIHKKTGLLCNLNNEEEFYKNLEVLVKDKNLRKKYGLNAYNHIKKFSWDKIIKRYEKLYNNLK